MKLDIESIIGLYIYIYIYNYIVKPKTRNQRGIIGVIDLNVTVPYGIEYKQTSRI